MEQQTLRILGNVKAPMRKLPETEVALCRCITEAVRLCMKSAYVRRSEEDWAELLGMSKGTLNTILNWSEARAERAERQGKELRKRHFPGDKFGILQREAGNLAVSQWLEMDTLGQLESKREALARLEALEREAQQLRASL